MWTAHLALAEGHYCNFKGHAAPVQYPWLPLCRPTELFSSLEWYPRHLPPPQCSAGHGSAHLALTEGHSSSFCLVSSSSGMLEASQ